MSASSEIREKFLRFFEKNGHRIVPSAPLVPRLDPTLLFINAGMNQFKGVFTGQEKREYKRAASSQKCVRAGGKHNDLENVGRTARHHTFFEMLGNFSFGDYFKEEAIRLAWEFVTKELRLPEERLYVSIFTDDGEAFKIWNKKIGLDPKRIYRFGEKDNFWAMGETGPCGPCSEIFFDQGESVGCGKPGCDVGCDCDRYIEFWNLVFMEFERKPDGTRNKLPKPSIDTGMGLERVTAITQGKASNYETDLFQEIFQKISTLSGTDYWKKASDETKISMRIVADHVRAMTFLIADGVHPSNEGRGYVLRRIMRRGMRHARKAGISETGLSELSKTVVEKMGGHFGELKKNASVIFSSIRREEERFAETIDRGLSLLETEITKLKKEGGSTLSGAVSFRLYDTYGFPKDLTADILREQGLSLDDEGFEEAFALHREKARGSWKGSATNVIDGLVAGWVAKKEKSEFLGYDELASSGKIRFLVRGGEVVADAKEGDEVELLSDRTPFYGEAGGQVGDIGTISGEGFSLEVIDTKKPAPGILLHKCRVTDGEVWAGAEALFSVDTKAREGTTKNHTATHILHATLREVLGSHVEQKGSWVSPERLRFDFVHPSAVGEAELAAIDQKINERIWSDARVETEEMPIEKALQSGATALFDEKYGKTARVITVGDYSKELCGGTHLSRTGEVGLFKIVKEASVAAGIRRIEAVTGHRALHHLSEIEKRLRAVAGLLGSSADDVVGRIETILKQQKEMKKKGASSVPSAAGEASVTNVNGVRFLRWEVGEVDAKGLRDLADRQLEKVGSGVVALGAKQDGKGFVVVKVSKDLVGRVRAGDLVSAAAKTLGGSGGGRPDMAQAGGPNADLLPAALEAIANAIK
ncbi:MAG: alanine--tRNA ligase [Pseudomonadota bacterium]